MRSKRNLVEYTSFHLEEPQLLSLFTEYARPPGMANLVLKAPHTENGSRSRTFVDMLVDVQREGAAANAYLKTSAKCAHHTLEDVSEADF